MTTTQVDIADASRAPCGNEDCDKCDPRPRFTIVTERVQRLFHTRTIKAATQEEALRIYDEGTAWPSSYDDRPGEILEEHAPIITVAEPRNERVDDFLCWHNLPHMEFERAGDDACALDASAKGAR